jgi:hypothetical protein
MTDLVFPQRPLNDIVKDWLNGDRAKAFLLFGEKGSGKSVFTQVLVRDALEVHPSGIIRLDLHNLTGLHHRLPTMKEMVSECLARGFDGEHEFSYGDYRQMLAMGALVIVDGIEKALEQLTPYDGEVLVREVFRFVSADSREPLMITCRPETMAAFPFIANPNRVSRVELPRYDSHKAVDKAA